MWCPTEPTIDEEHLYSFPPWLKPSLKSRNPQFILNHTHQRVATNTKQEPASCSLVVVIYNTFYCQRFHNKTPTELPKQVHFRLFSDDLIPCTNPLCFWNLFQIHLCTWIWPIRWTIISNYSAHVDWKWTHSWWCLSLVRWALWWTIIWSHLLILRWGIRGQDKY